MLAVLSAEGARFDTGAVAMAVARRIGNSGERVLFVDADASGSRLAQRFGGADSAAYSPADRGLPSLIVAREPLTLRLLAQHCYSLDVANGSLWSLFGPHHPAGAQYAARWLAERVENLVAVGAQRRLVVSSTLRSAAEHLAPLLSAAQVVAVAARVATIDDARALMAQSRDAGLRRHGSGQQALIVEGDSPLGDDEIFLESGMRVAGRLPVIDDDRILRLQGGRRDRSFTNHLDDIAARLLALLNLVGASDADHDDAGTATDLRLAEHPEPQPAVNGTHDRPPHAARLDHAARSEERV